MSRGYDRAKSISGKPCPPHRNKEVWKRYQKIAADTRLAQIYTHNLPETYTTLYELTKLNDELFEAVKVSGLLTPKTSCEVIKKVRRTGKVPVRVEIWTEPGRVQELVNQLGVVEIPFGDR